MCVNYEWKVDVFGQGLLSRIHKVDDEDYVGSSNFYICSFTFVFLKLGGGGTIGCLLNVPVFSQLVSSR